MARNSGFDLPMSEKRSGIHSVNVETPAGQLQSKRQVSIQSRLFVLGGFLMVPVCVLGLFWQQSFIWGICPQALVVMFIRQSQHAYDSLGAAGYPDLAVAVLYYPLVGWILSRAEARNRLWSVVIRVGVWHVLAIGLAIGTGAIRNQLWGF